MTLLLKDWLVTPFDLTVRGREIYVSGNIDNRIAVLNLEGDVLRYYTVAKGLEFDNVSVAVNSRGQVFALSSQGLWELTTGGQARELLGFGVNKFPIDHMTIGPDDGLYVSQRGKGKSTNSKILKLGLDGTIIDILEVRSNRVSDLDFDSHGNLFMFDAEHGQILKYAQGRDVEIVSAAFPEVGGAGPAYLAIDKADRLYISSAQYGLALVSVDGKMTRIGAHVTGDLVFHEGLLYALDIYTSVLYRFDIDIATVRSKRVLLEGDVPWYIDHQGDVVTGDRSTFSGRAYYNYHISDPRIEANHLLNKLQPSQYTFDNEGNTYLLVGNELRKVTPAGDELFRVALHEEGLGSAGLRYNAVDDMVYYFSPHYNSVIRAGIKGAGIYHEFSVPVKWAFLAITPQGKIYAGVISSDVSRLVDISRPGEEKIVWVPEKEGKFAWFHVASSPEGNLYVALAPVFQGVFVIDPSQGKALSIVPRSPSRYEMGFVDPQGFTVTKSGKVILSAPGLLVEFSQE